MSVKRQCRQERPNALLRGTEGFLGGETFFSHTNKKYPVTYSQYTAYPPNRTLA